jgi:hypothetical protein
VKLFLRVAQYLLGNGAAFPDFCGAGWQTLSKSLMQLDLFQETFGHRLPSSLLVSPQLTQTKKPPSL